MLQGYRRIAAVLLVLVPTVAGFFGVELPKEVLDSVFNGFGEVLAGVLMLLSIFRPAPSKLGPGA